MEHLMAPVRALVAGAVALSSLLLPFGEQGEQAPATPQAAVAPAADASQGLVPGTQADAARARADRIAELKTKKRASSLGRRKARRQAPKKLTGKKKAGFVWPVRGPITSRFGRRHIFGAIEPHRGMDIACSKRQAIRAAKAGRVIMAGRIPIYGKIVVIKHRNGYSTLYAHMRKLHTGVNDRVRKREVIGKCGETGRATGPHLHFEVRRHRAHRNPRPYLNR